MGQPIEIVSSTVIDEVLVIDTDRSVSGQDGAGFESLDDALAVDTFPALLARRLFEELDGLAHVWSASNAVVVGRPGGWDDSTAGTAEDVVRRFFVYYGDDTPVEAAAGA
jgi:hypothetical protein